MLQTSRYNQNTHFTQKKQLVTNLVKIQ